MTLAVTRTFVTAASLVLGLVAVSCSRRNPSPQDSAIADSVARARQDSINRALPGYVVDSIFPVEEEIRRFQAAAGGERVSSLSNGIASRAALIKAFVAALSDRDSVKLQQMLVTPREFIDLIYPESQYTKPPYRQSPGLLWTQIQSENATGFRRLMERVAGTSIRYVSHTCSGNPDRQGHNSVWSNCSVILATDSGQNAAKLFGAIIERDGKFKFLSYANAF